MKLIREIKKKENIKVLKNFDKNAKRYDKQYNKLLKNLIK